MSRYEKVKGLGEEDFRRLTGVKKGTFEIMVNELKKDLKKKKKSGKPMKLSVEDKLLLALEYLRENRTYYHIAMGYGVNESTAIRSSHWVEDVLSKSEKFKLPGKKAIEKSEMEYEVFVVDATETPIERPSIKSKKTQKKKDK